MSGPDGAPKKSGALAATARVIWVVITRLRFLAVFVLVFLVIGQWESLRTLVKRLTIRPSAEAAISADTEFFCPMDPGVVSDWPSKCPICYMTLVRHKKGDAAPLPDGVIARMQFAPYRLWLGGIRTSAIDYSPLTRSITLEGKVASVAGNGTYQATIAAFPEDLAEIEKGMAVRVVLPEDRSRQESTATIVSLNPASDESPMRQVAISGSGGAGLAVGSRVLVAFKVAADQVEPFRATPTSAPTIKNGEARTIYRCMDHRDVVALASGNCPKDQSPLMAITLRENERVGWWCPMHPDVTSTSAGASCKECGGMTLVPRKLSYRRPGTVLAVPADAVIDDGSRTVVYVDSGAGMFDAKQVKVGPRFGDAFPVISGLEPGDRVASQGAFLIDAETRLNSNVAAGYFGSSAPASKPSQEKAESWLDGLATADRPLALAQKRCPVTNKPLGSMGVPVKVTAKGQTVFLCCDGCTGAIEKNPDRYLKALATEPAGAKP